MAREMEEQRESASALIAAKMLQGWALLAEHCPVCLTPLMRNKEKRMYCVSCQQWVVRENGNANNENAGDKVGSATPVEDRGGNSTSSQTQTLPKANEAMRSVKNTLETKAMELCKGMEGTSDVVQLKLLLDTLAACLGCLEKVSTVQ